MDEQYNVKVNPENYKVAVRKPKDHDEYGDSSLNSSFIDEEIDKVEINYI
jgi:hypothetical protein